MTDTLDELHAQALLGPLANNNALTVFDGVVPNPWPEPPYVLPYLSITWPTDGIGNAIDHQSVTCVTTATVHCVGLTAAACRAISMQVRSSLLNIRPTVAGRTCGLVTLDDSVPPAKDETTGRAVMDLVLVFSYTSVPA